MEEYRYKLSNSRNVSTGLDTKQKVAGEPSKIEVKICFLACSWKGTLGSMALWEISRSQNHLFYRFLLETIKEIQFLIYITR